ncbi:MAG: tetratricopeptide repeat protein [Aequorivita sp.]
MKRLIIILLISVSFQSISQNGQKNRKVFKEAQKHFSEKSYPKTIDLLNKLDSRYISKNPKINYYRLRSYQEMGSIHKAYEISSSKKEIKVPRKLTELGKVKKQIELKIRAYDSLYTLAEKQFSNNYVNTAISTLNQAIAIDSFYFKAYVFRSELYYENIEFEKSIEDCNQVTSNLKSIPEIYLRRGLANYHRGRKEQAIPDFTKSITLRPTAKAYYYRAKTICQSSNPDCCECPINDLDSAIALDPEYSRALTLRGDLLLSSGKYERAIVDFDRVLKNESDNLDVLFKRAECHVQLNHDSEAEADYTRLTELNAYLPTAFFRKGFYSAKRNYHQPDSLKNAISYYDQAITLDPSVSSYYYHRAISKKMRSNYSDAIKDLDTAINLEPVVFDYYDQRNTCHYLKHSPYSKRKTDLQAAIRNFEDHETDSLAKHYHIAKTNRLLFHFLSDHVYLEQSIHHLNKALEFDIDNVAVHFEKGLLYKIDLKDYPLAIKSFQKVLSLEPQNLESHLNLAWCLNFNSEFEASYQAFINAKKHFPNDAQVHDGLEAIRKKIK